MADEISLSLQCRLANGLLNLDFVPPAIQLDQAAARGAIHVQVIGNAASEAIAVAADITTPGIACFRNLDETNAIRIGPYSGGSMVTCLEVRAGELSLLRVGPGVTLHAQAAAGTPSLLCYILSD